VGKERLEKGLICKGVGGFYQVHLDSGGTILSRPRGRFRQRMIRPIVGDRVVVRIGDDPRGVIEEVLPRETELIRPPIANVDTVVIVLAMARPDPDRFFLDRLLVAVRVHGLRVILCLNKADLVEPEAVEPWIAVYRSVVDEIIVTSAQTGRGVAELSAALRGHISTMAGPSGAGKSALLNALCPDFERATGDVSEKLGHGRHTTRAVELLPLPDGGWIADTPGFSQIDIGDIPPEELGHYFPDFAPFVPQCRFVGCLHAREPDCGVRQAADEGAIEPSRYRHYTIMLEELQERQARQYR